MPLPPYISRPGGATTADESDYQTVYAARKGAVAAPTAGLHFTDSLMEAVQFIATPEKRQGLKVSCPEEVAFRAGWISAEQLERQAQPMLKNWYGQYLLRLLHERAF